MVCFDHAAFDVIILSCLVVGMQRVLLVLLDQLVLFGPDCSRIRQQQSYAYKLFHFLENKKLN